jgi:hypothetical protein
MRAVSSAMEGNVGSAINPRCEPAPREGQRSRLKEMQAAEYAARWEPEFKRVEAMRDALAAEMREVYPGVVAQLVDIFQRATECDRECSRINGSGPDGEHRRLRNVELVR